MRIFAVRKFKYQNFINVYLPVDDAYHEENFETFTVLVLFCFSIDSISLEKRLFARQETLHTY